MNHISTLTVSGYGLVNVKYDGIFDENTFYINQDYENNIYVKTKFLAEEEIFKALENGLVANIYRIGNLTNRYSDYKFQFNSYENAFINKLRAIKELGILPENLKNYELELTPVDICADSIVKIAIKNNIKYNINVFHIYNNHYIPMSFLTDILNENHIDIKYVSNKNFEEEIAKNSSSSNILPGFIDQFNLQLDSTSSSKINFSNKYTNKILSSFDFNWPTITKEYLKYIIRRI